MLILLPPSETKRPGGVGDRLNLSGLRYPTLARARRELIRDVRAAAVEAARAAARESRTSDRSDGSRAKSSAAEREQLAHNRQLTLSATMPALDRYTGVLFSALVGAGFTADERAFAGRHVVVQSALFGPIGALDAIPAYRLSFDSRVPALGRSLRRFWTDATAKLVGTFDGPLLDLRSAGYADLMPLPAGRESAYVSVTTRGEDGLTRALNHFNKQAKGALVREIVQAGIQPTTIDELLDWARSTGIEMVRRGDGIELVVPRIVGNKELCRHRSAECGDGVNAGGHGATRTT